MGKKELFFFTSELILSNILYIYKVLLYSWNIFRGLILEAKANTKVGILVGRLRLIC